MLALEKSQHERAKLAKGRNQARALRRLAAEDTVSENESEEKEWVSEDEIAGASSVKSRPYFVSTLNHNKSVVRPPLSVTFHSAITVRKYTPACLSQQPAPTNWERFVLKWSIFRNRLSRKRILRTCPI